MWALYFTSETVEWLVVVGRKSELFFFSRGGGARVLEVRWCIHALDDRFQRIVSRYHETLNSNALSSIRNKHSKETFFFLSFDFVMSCEGCSVSFCRDTRLVHFDVVW